MRKLFEAWWDRDEARFRGTFTEMLMNDGTPMEQTLARDLLAANPIAAESFAIFDQFFTDRRKLKRISLILNTAAGVVVACSEADRPLDIQADCTGMPTLHLFLVTMSGLNPRSITHLAKTETIDADKLSIWTEGGT